MDPENPYLGRIVVLLTPLFVGIAGLITAWVGKHFPGVEIDGTELSALFVAGALAAGGAVIKWLDNRGKYEQGIQLVGAAAQEPPAGDVR